MTELPIRDALAAIIWVTTNLALIAAGWRLSRRVAPADPPTARIIHTTVFSWSVIVVVATLLGLCHALTPVALLAGVAVVAILAITRTAESTPAASANIADRAFLFGWLVFFGFGLGHILDNGLLLFPTDWDSLMYHIPLIDQWLQARSLYAPREAVWFNPGNNELVGLWIVAPFSGDFLIGLINMPSAILLSLGFLELTRQFELGRVYAFLSGFGVVSSFVVFRQLVDAENDISAAALFLVSVYYAIRHARSGGLGDLLLGAAAVGLLAGIKYYALGYAFAAGISLVFGALFALGRRAALRAAAVCLLGALLLGGYWYLRNAWLTGTPLYPKGHNAQTEVMAQWRTGIWYSTLLGNGQPEVLSLAIDAVRQASFCYMLAFLAAPIVLVWLVVSGLWRKRDGIANGTAAVRLTLAFAVAGAGLVWGCLPFAAETWPPGSLNSLRDAYIPVRFGLSFLSLSVVALVLVIRDLGAGLEAGAGLINRSFGERRLLSVRGVAMLPIVAFGIVSGYQSFVQAARFDWYGVRLDSLLLGVSIGPFLMFGRQCRVWWPLQRSRMAIAAAICLLASGAVGAEYLAQSWHAGFSPFYDRQFRTASYSRLASCAPAVTRVCVLDYQYYPFFGSKRQFQAARPFLAFDYAALRNYLLAHDSTVVVATMSDPFSNGRYRDCHSWLTQRPGVFHVIEQDPVFLICDVDRIRLDDATSEMRPQDR